MQPQRRRGRRDRRREEGDKVTRRQGDKVKEGIPLPPLVPVSPCPLVSSSSPSLFSAAVSAPSASLRSYLNAVAIYGPRANVLRIDSNCSTLCAGGAAPPKVRKTFN